MWMELWQALSGLVFWALPHATVCCEKLPAKLGEEVGDYAAVAIAAMSEKRRNV